MQSYRLDTTKGERRENDNQRWYAERTFTGSAIPRASAPVQSVRPQLRDTERMQPEPTTRVPSVGSIGTRPRTGDKEHDAAIVRTYENG